MSNDEQFQSSVVALPSYEFVEIRALCDEIMNSLCQARALLVPVNEDEFFYRHDSYVLKNYFNALDTIIGTALESKDAIHHLIDEWQQRPADSAFSCVDAP
jgi:hypothetical protein